MKPETSTSHIVLKNQQFYDQRYATADVDAIVQKVSNAASFLRDATLTDTSWHGLYQGGFAEKIRGKRVLELGSGNGLNALIMASLGAEVTALDISKSSAQLIEEASERLKLSVKAMAGDFLELEFAQRWYDVIVGKDFLHHLTHDLENAFLRKVSMLLKPDGEARFFEPAVNSKLLDTIRYVIPVPNRPSVLSRAAFKKYKDLDPHPERDNSTLHYTENGRLFFNDVQVTLVGSLERFHRLLPSGQFNRRYRRWAHRMEVKLPLWFRYAAARSQVIVYRNPRT